MKRPAPHPSHFDITEAMAGWNFEPGQVNVRVVPGKDGKPKLQMRLDLGILQMEMTGRPDGRRPHHSLTELDFHLLRLRNHQRRRGSDTGFFLGARDCQALREESAMFYHRYLSLFVLEQYDAVIRDTQHNLEVMDLCNKYGRKDRDRYHLEQYRPYIIMMQGRARAGAALNDGYVQTAIAYLRGALRGIAGLYANIPSIPTRHRKRMFRESDEANTLYELIRQLRKQLPPDPRKALQKKLKSALHEQQYEQAAQLRDQLLALDTAQSGAHSQILQKSAKKTTGKGARSGQPPKPGKPLPPRADAPDRRNPRRRKPEQ